MPDEASCSPTDCRCRGGDIRGNLQPRILMALCRCPACGYDLLETLRQEPGGLEADTGNLYRTLRCMEQGGWVKSGWDTQGPGPAKRVYELTDEGRDLLEEWVGVLGRTRRWLDNFLNEYEDLIQRRSYERV